MSLALKSWEKTVAVNMIVGCLMLVASVTTRFMKPVSSIPDDFKLGVTGGIGALLCSIGFKYTLIVTSSSGIVNGWDYRVLLSMIGVIVVVFFESRVNVQIRKFSYIFGILFITLLSLCIRGGMSNLLVSPLGAEELVSMLFGQISTQGWAGYDFEVLRYVITESLMKYVAIISIVTAIVLLSSLTRTGYDKEFFQTMLNESKRLSLVFLVDGFTNIIIAPLFGLPLLAPLSQSVASYVVGARTGFASVICGTLFLITSPFIVQITQIIPIEAVGAALVVNCFTAINAVRHVDESSVVKLIPSYMVFVLIPYTNSIGAGFSFSYLLLFSTWASSDMWTSITPQMIFNFSSMILLSLTLTNALATFNQLIIAVILLLGGGVLGAYASLKYCDKIQERFGVHVSGDSEPELVRTWSPRRQRNSNSRVTFANQATEFDLNATSIYQPNVVTKSGHDVIHVVSSHPPQTVVEFDSDHSQVSKREALDELSVENVGGSNGTGASASSTQSAQYVGALTEI